MELPGVSGDLTVAADEAPGSDVIGEMDGSPGEIKGGSAKLLRLVSVKSLVRFAAKKFTSAGTETTQFARGEAMVLEWAHAAKEKTEKDKRELRERQRAMLRRHKSWQLRIATAIIDDQEESISKEAASWVIQVIRDVRTIQRAWREAIRRKKLAKDIAFLNDEEKPVLVRNDWGWQIENDPWKILLKRSASQSLIDAVEGYDSEYEDDDSIFSDSNSSDYSDSDDDRSITSAEGKSSKKMLKSPSRAMRMAMLMLRELQDKANSPHAASSGEDHSPSRIFKVFQSAQSLDTQTSLDLSWSPTSPWGESLRGSGPKGGACSKSKNSGGQVHKKPHDASSVSDEHGCNEQSIGGSMPEGSELGNASGIENTAHLYKETMTHAQLEQMSVNGSGIGQHGNTGTAAIRRTQLTSMSIRIAKEALHAIAVALNLDEDAMGPQDIQQILRNSAIAKWRMTLLKKSLADSVDKDLRHIKSSSEVVDILNYPMQSLREIQETAASNKRSRLRNAGKRLKHMEVILNKVESQVNSYLGNLKRHFSQDAPGGIKVASEQNGRGETPLVVNEQGSLPVSESIIPEAGKMATLSAQETKSANVVTLPSLGEKQPRLPDLSHATGGLPTGLERIEQLKRASRDTPSAFGLRVNPIGERLPRMKNTLRPSAQLRRSVPMLPYAYVGTREPRFMAQAPANQLRNMAVPPLSDMNNCPGDDPFTISKINAICRLQNELRFVSVAQQQLAVRMKRSNLGRTLNKNRAAEDCERSNIDFNKPSWKMDAAAPLHHSPCLSPDVFRKEFGPWHSARASNGRRFQ